MFPPAQKPGIFPFFLGGLRSVDGALNFMVGARWNSGEEALRCLYGLVCVSDVGSPFAYRVENGGPVFRLGHFGFVIYKKKGHWRARDSVC